MKKRLLSWLLAVCLVVGMLPAAALSVFAEDTGHTCVFDQEVVSGDYLASAADCTNAATYYYSCTCGEKGEQTFTSGEALGHDVEGQTGTTFSAQFHRVQCTRCNSWTVATHVEGWKVTEEATCTQIGTELKYCTVCGYESTATREIAVDPDAHNYENGTCTLCGATEPEEPAVNGLSAMSFALTSSATAEPYEMSPAFDPATKTYTILVPDSSNYVYAKATLADGVTGTITAAWVNLNNDTEKTQALTSGKSTGQYLMGAVKVGDYSNTMTITVAGTADGESVEDVYTVNIVRTPTLTALGLDGIKLNETFLTATTAYTATTAEESVTVTATPRDESYTVTVNGGSNTNVALAMGENVITVVVKNSAGYEKTYTITVTRKAAITVSFDVNVDNPNITVKDANKTVVTPVDGVYTVISGGTYSYTVQKDGYVGQTSEFTMEESGTVAITMVAATANPNLPNYEAEWGNFRNGENNLGITDAATPYDPDDAELLWAAKYGTGWSAAPGSPILVDGDIITYVGSTIKRLDRNTGNVVAEGTMVASSSYSIVPATYADGMIFVGLSGGRIQCFNAATLESLWVYTDPLGGQPNCPITYKNGYIYAGFWNAEAKDANFACIYTIDEDHTQTTEAKLASWSYTRTGGFYWAGAYASDKFVVVGTDNGVSDYTTESASLLVFDRLTGDLVDSYNGLRGDIRSNVSYDPSSDRVFFTSKGGILCNAKVDWNTGKISDFHQTVLQDANGNQYAMSTCTPSVYNGRIYIGVAGTSQFGANSGHAIAVYDLNSDGSMTLAYTYAIVGYPQTSAMVTTAYADEDEGYVYIYLPYNMTPGGVSVLKDKKGQTAPLTTTDEGYSEVFTPISPLSQYCICSTIADEYGTIYYKNDSCYMMAITSKIESLELIGNPGDDDFKAVTRQKNGTTRDVTKYISVNQNNEDGLSVTYTYGFDNANYGLKTLGIYSVTLPEGEGYTVTGNSTANSWEEYTFTVSVSDIYEKTDDFAVKVNGETLTANEDGSYTVAEPNDILVITVEGVEKIACEPVTVYFTRSHDEKFDVGKDTKEVMALRKIEVPYFDLALYGLEEFYFSSEEYGSDGGEHSSALEPGTAEYAYGKVTMMHLFIYAVEVYYCDVDPADAGRGYLYEHNLMGTDVFTISGSAGSSYLNQYWGADENLNYYLNYRYPLASDGWGSTSDQILLHDGDVVTMGHFSDWAFYGDSEMGFNYLTPDEENKVYGTTTVKQGDELKLTVYRAGADMTGNYTTGHYIRTDCPTIYYAAYDKVDAAFSKWTSLGTASSDGTITIDTSTWAPGTYVVALAGQPGADYPDAICSTPGGIVVVVEEGEIDKPETLLGDVNGDGKVDLDDVQLVYKAAAGFATLTDDQAKAADVNSDGKIDLDDMQTVYGHVVGATTTVTTTN